MIRFVKSQGRLTWEDHLFWVSMLLSILCVIYIWQHPSPYSITVPEVILPFGISLALVAYTVRLKQQDRPFDQSELMVKYGLAGILCSLVIGGGEVLLHLFSGLPIGMFPDQILSFMSIGVVTGALSGRTVSIHRNPQNTNRDRILSETSWARQPGQTPISNAIVEALMEIEGSDPNELEPLYTHVDPETIAELRSHDGSPWQFTFFTDDYEIRISSHGTVTVYATGVDEESIHS